MPMPNEYDSSEYDPGEALPDYMKDALYDAFSLITISTIQNPQDLCSGVMIVKAKSGLIWARENVLIGRGV